MSEKLWRVVEDRVEPMLPGNHQPDGASILTTKQASERSGISEDALEQRWDRQNAAVLPTTDLSGKPTVNPDNPEPRPEDLKLWEHMTPEERDELTRELLYSQLEPREFQLFKQICVDRKFSIFSRKLWPEMDSGELIIVTTVMALRDIADRGGRRKGYIEPLWRGPKDEDTWSDVWNGVVPPAWAKVGTVRKGWKEPVFGKASWASYAPIDKTSGIDILDDFWLQHGPGQLAKCAEALSLRIMAPEDLGGVYCKEELAKKKADERNKAAGFSGGLKIAGSTKNDDQPSPDYSDSQDEPPEVDQDEYEGLKETAGMVGPQGIAFEAMMAGKHKNLARYNRPMFYRVVAQELRKIIRQRDSA